METEGPAAESRQRQSAATGFGAAGGRIGALGEWVEQRYDLRGITHLITTKKVPWHRHSLWYFFGGMTLFFFATQVVTGILLALYYRPTPDAAFESVQFIMTEVSFGWLIRSIHGWAAHLMVASVMAHLASTFFLAAYRKPRELTWMGGCILLFVTLTFGFSGYLLPWNELSYFATRVGSDIVGVLPLVGGFLLQIVRGGEQVSGETLTRFFAVHVMILPAVTMGLIGFHLWLVQMQGISSPPRTRVRRQMPFFPNFALREALGWAVALAALAALAAYAPIELGVKADPFAPAPAGIMPEWYFVPMFQLLKLIPAQILIFEGEKVGIISFGLGAVLLILLPFWEPWVGRRVVRALGAVVIAGAAAMMALAYLG